MSDVLAGAGVLIAAGCAGAALIWQPSARRSAAMLIALALIPALILGDQWHSTAISSLRAHPARFAALLLAGIAVVGVLLLVFRRGRALLPLAIIAALPFRIPLQAGAQEANLLVPLYLVIAAGVIEAVLAGSRGSVRAPADVQGRGAVKAVRWLLALAVGVYALQSLYSEDLSKAVQNAAFFYVPFALAFVLIADARWDRRLLKAALAVVGAEAAIFALVGFWEYETRHLLWNPMLIRSNAFHTYFRVNSLFWDSNIYGRYMALALTAILTAVVWSRGRRAALGAGLLAVIWLGLLITFSQSAYIALLCGLAVLAALRWSVRYTAIACVVALLGAGAFLIAAGRSVHINLSSQSSLSSETSGRTSLVSGGVKLFERRPLWGYGSGSFGRAFQRHQTRRAGPVTLSHTAPVTVAAEQGLPGLAVYLALLVAAFAVLLGGIARLVPGLRSGPAAAGAGPGPAVEPGGDESPEPPAFMAIARAAVLCCFVVLLVHTIAYADFLEDPATWVLLALGASLLVRTAPDERPRPPEKTRRVLTDAPPSADQSSAVAGGRLSAERGPADPPRPQPG